MKAIPLFHSGDDNTPVLRHEKFKVNSKNAKITVPEKTKKGTYSMKVKVTAKGNANYMSGSKTVTVKVAVKQRAGTARPRCATIRDVDGARHCKG